MKNKIQEINDYFVNKIITKDYEIVKTTLHNFYILIDGEYNFSIWVANQDCGIRTYDVGGDNFMTLTFTKEEKEIIWNNVKDFLKQKELEIKMKQFEQLKQELHGNNIL